MQETKRLSLAELKAKASDTNILENVEAIRGGDSDYCHNGFVGKNISVPKPAPPRQPSGLLGDY